jgi:hypothetical protein
LLCCAVLLSSDCMVIRLRKRVALFVSYVQAIKLLHSEYLALHFIKGGKTSTDSWLTKN